MLGEIIFTTAAFILFIYIFLYKMIYKNDTAYLIVLLVQALGILINLIQILFGVLNNAFFTGVCYIFCIIIPALIILLEIKGINFSEIMYLTAARGYQLFGNNKLAKDILINLVTKYSRSYYGHKWLAEIYEKEGGMRKAIDEYVKVLDIRKDDYKSYFKISILLNDLGKKDESIQMLKILTKKKPEIYEAAEMLGNLYLEKERFNEALDLYMQALKIYPDKYEIYYNLGIVYTRMNDFEMAKEYYEKAAELNSDFVNSRYRLGQIALLYRDIDGAEDNFLNSLNGETEAEASLELSKIYALKNEPERSLKYANRAVDLEPELYKKVQEEPLLFSVKKDVVPPSEEMAKKKDVLSHKEKMVNEYLQDTYNLTKKINLKEAQDEGINISEFKWDKEHENQGYQKQRIDPN
ncbi:MAG: tetratricopeptide repeat protein [Firmicutes bacterium]|nr:tetratricopeptide repeat protein [Bacillota bacterium]